MERIDELILHTKFKEKAENADSLDRMLSFCKSFLEKYEPKKTTSKTGEEFIDRIYQERQNAILGEFVLGDYSLSDHSVVRTTQHQIIPITYSKSIPEFLSVEDRLIETKRSIMENISIEMIKRDLVEFDSMKSYSDMSTVITGKVNVVKGKTR